MSEPITHTGFPLMRGLLNHIVLTVRDPTTSTPFYDAFLGFMGYKQEGDFAWVLGTGPASVSLHLAVATGPGSGREHDRYSPGLHHMAWRAESRQDVDQMHEHVQSRGGLVLDAPADYPQYNKGRGYYAVFFADPDGLKLEFVFTPVD